MQKPVGHRGLSSVLRTLMCATGLCVAMAGPDATSAFALSAGSNVIALSELKTIPGDAPSDDSSEPQTETAPTQLPLPDPLINKAQPKDEPAAETGDKQDDTPDGPVEISNDISKLPAPVSRMRELMIEAARTGDISRLTPLLGKGPTQTQVGGSDAGDNPAETLKGLSGDPDGIEIMAILIDVLSTGYAHIGAGTPEEMYVWPYFSEKALNTLTPPEKVDLLRLVTAGDYLGMQEFGNYNFYRTGITPDGQWKFFVAGD